MAQIRIAVTFNDGERFEVDTTLFTIVAWERKFKRKASDLGNGVGVEDLAFMAHTAAKDAGIQVPMMLDDFIKKARSIEVVGQDDENPTDPAPTATA